MSRKSSVKTRTRNSSAAIDWVRKRLLHRHRALEGGGHAPVVRIGVADYVARLVGRRVVVWKLLRLDKEAILLGARVAARKHSENEKSDGEGSYHGSARTEWLHNARAVLSCSPIRLAFALARLGPIP